MKDKEKQIEEMAKIMCSPCPDGKECSGTWCYKRVLDCANEFYEQGYRKLSEDSILLSKTDFDLILPPNSVVLSREEYDILLRISSELETSQKSISLLTRELNDYKQRYESSEKRYEQLVQSSCEALEKKGKETAEKILNEQYQECKVAEKEVLIARGGNKNDDYYKGFSLGMTNAKMHIEELAKQFGVDLKGEE